MNFTYVNIFYSLKSSLIYTSSLARYEKTPNKCIFKDQFSTEVYSMDSIKATCNIYFCDYGTVLVDKNKTWQLLANLVLGKTPV